MGKTEYDDMILAFQRSIVDKIRSLREWMNVTGVAIEIMVDGGINNKTAKECVNAGAHVLVAGTYLFNHPVSLQQGIQDLLSNAN